MAETSRKPGENGEREQSDTRDRSRVQAVADQAAAVARQVGDKGADAAKRVGETTADAAHRTAEVASHVGEKITEAGKRTVETVAGVAQRTNEVAAKATRNATDQGREATMAGLRAIAGVQGPLAEASFEQSRRVVELTARVTDVYREAAERAAGDVQALFDSWTSLGRGLQRWQQAYFDHLEQWVQSVAGKREDLVRSNSPVGFAEVQRDLYIDFVGKTLRASTALLQVSGQIAQDAVRPLQERAQARA